MKEITFEDIKKANETIITTDIKGKQYSEVNQRIKAFRMVYPTGTIETEMVSNENGVCIFKAKVGYTKTVVDKETGVLADVYTLLGTGTAYEKENSTFINKTSYIENCETSALGRALGMAGFGIDTSVASAEEVQNAMANQTTKEDVDLLAKFEELLAITDTDREKLYEFYSVKSNKDLTKVQLAEAIKIMESKK